MARSRLMDRGNEIVKIIPSTVHIDADGNEIRFPAGDGYERRATVAGDRQADAELSGQVSNKVVRLVVRDAPDIDSYAEIWFRNEQWDMAGPPHFSNGASRAIRHVELDLRSRNKMPRGEV